MVDIISKARDSTRLDNIGKGVQILSVDQNPFPSYSYGGNKPRQGVRKAWWTSPDLGGNVYGAVVLTLS